MITLVTAPPARALSNNQRYIDLSTDADIAAPATIVIDLPLTGGPTAGQTLQLEWAGYDLTFTVTDPVTTSALDLPVKGAESLAEYADILAERLAAHEVLHDYFSIARSSGASETITLTQRVLSVVTIVVTEDLSNVDVTATDVTAVTPTDALRALVEVWKDTGALATDTRLATLHAPYLLPAGTVALDIHSAFASVAPHLPGTNTISPTLISAPGWGEATDAQLKYYLRYADKSGSPAVADTMQRSASYYAYHGALSADSNALATTPLRHAYLTRQGDVMVKPITIYQPDWMYWVCPASGVTGVYLYVETYWSDGTEDVYTPFGTTPLSVEANKLYWFATSYRMLKLGTQTPPSGADPAAYMVGYRVSLTTGSLMLGIHSVTYEIRYSYFTDLHILFANGMGGCESVGFLGKNADLYKTESEEYQRPRTNGWTAEDGDFALLSASGRRVWEVNTGWHTSPDYLEHLRQLPLADAWLIDSHRQKFLRVIVEPGEMEVIPGDETLYSLPFTIRAAWEDSAANV